MTYIRTATGPDPPGSSRRHFKRRKTPVPRVLLSITLAGPAPSGSTGHDPALSGPLSPSPASPEQAALSFNPTAATAGWCRSSTSSRTNSASRRKQDQCQSPETSAENDTDLHQQNDTPTQQLRPVTIPLAPSAEPCRQPLQNTRRSSSKPGNVLCIQHRFSEAGTAATRSAGAGGAGSQARCGRSTGNRPYPPGAPPAGKGRGRRRGRGPTYGKAHAAALRGDRAPAPDLDAEGRRIFDAAGSHEQTSDYAVPGGA